MSESGIPPPHVEPWQKGCRPDSLAALGENDEGAPILDKCGGMVNGLVGLDKINVLGIAATGRRHHIVTLTGLYLAVLPMVFAGLQEVIDTASHHQPANRAMAVQDAVNGHVGRPVTFNLGQILRQRVADQATRPTPGGKGPTTRV